MPASSSTRRLCALASAVLAVAAVPAAAHAAHARHVVVRSTTCAGGADGWSPPRSGRTLFTVRNPTADNFFLVELVAADSATPGPRYGRAYGKVYGEIGILAPKTSVVLDAVLPPGSYFFRCLDRTGAMTVSRVEAVRGRPVPGAHPYAPLFNSQLPLAMLRYRIAVAPVLKRLGADTDRLARAVQSGRLAAARKLWLPAHLDYARLGVAYGTFGELDGEIDGRGSGFPRLEHGLWHGESQAALAPVAAALRHSVRTLLARASSTRTLWVDSDLPLRAHEILENTLQFELTGKTNGGSNTNLATAWANTQATLLALDALRPLLAHGRAPKLIAASIRQTSRLADSFAAYRHQGGRWTPLASLRRRDRERLDSRTSALLETLAWIPGQLKTLPTKPTND